MASAYYSWFIVKGAMNGVEKGKMCSFLGWGNELKVSDNVGTEKDVATAQEMRLH